MNNEYVIKLRDALREELDATNTYARLLDVVPTGYKSVIEEIRQDEINHQGRLLDLILKSDPTMMDSFNEGLAQKG